VINRFTKFPKIWQIQLAKIRADGCAYRVALYLIEQAHWCKLVPLSNVTARKVGVSRNGKRTALQQLSKAGLVAVEERPRKSPLIKVRFLA
jgi:hypothetical protein